MHVLVAGAHGQIGQNVTRLLAESDDYTVRGMVREESQVSDIEELGAEAVVADLTGNVDHAVEGCDAVVFAAGSGGEDVWGVDRDGAIGLVDAAESHRIDRFVMVSSINADAPEQGPEPLAEYLRAKGEADEYLRGTDLTHTIVRPGALTNDPGTGLIDVGADLGATGTIPRADVARTLVAMLPKASTFDRSFDLLSGDEPIDEALEELVDGDEQ
jgi:uncharacterized protein YbjT (DUF2867 family)